MQNLQQQRSLMLRVLYLFLITSVNKLCTEKLVHLLKTSEILDEFQNFFFKQSLIDKCSNRECLTKHDGAPKLKSIFRFIVCMLYQRELGRALWKQVWDCSEVAQHI